MNANTDAELLVDMIVGPLFYRTFVTGLPPTIARCAVWWMRRSPRINDRSRRGATTLTIVTARRIYRALVVLTALITVALGLFAALRSAPVAQWEQSDTVSALQPQDQSAVLAPDRRVRLSHSITPVDPPMTVLVDSPVWWHCSRSPLVGSRPAPSANRRAVQDFLVARGPPARARVTLIPAV